jgi:hypothetical protein
MSKTTVNSKSATNTSGESRFASLEHTLLNLEEACAALPSAELEAYRAAQQSVVDARRSAETHEGLLQVC